MTFTYKTLGQAFPAAGAPADLYAVPGATQAIVEGITICNQSAAPTTFRVSVSVGGGATASKDYLCYDTEIGGNAVVNLNAVATMGAADVLRVESGDGSVSFNAFGVEIT
jgi:hypothetical protein